MIARLKAWVDRLFDDPEPPTPQFPVYPPPSPPPPPRYWRDARFDALAPAVAQLCDEAAARAASVDDARQFRRLASELRIMSETPSDG